MPDYHWRQKREDQLRECSVNRATLCALVAQREDDKRDMEKRIAELEGREEWIDVNDRLPCEEGDVWDGETFVLMLVDSVGADPHRVIAATPQLVWHSCQPASNAWPTPLAWRPIYGIPDRAAFREGE